MGSSSESHFSLLELRSASDLRDNNSKSSNLDYNTVMHAGDKLISAIQCMFPTRLLINLQQSWTSCFHSRLNFSIFQTAVKQRTWHSIQLSVADGRQAVMLSSFFVFWLHNQQGRTSDRTNNFSMPRHLGYMTDEILLVSYMSSLRDCIPGECKCWHCDKPLTQWHRLLV